MRTSLPRGRAIRPVRRVRGASLWDQEPPAAAANVATRTSRIALPLTVNPRTIATLTPAEAADRLDAGWLPFLFFTNVSTGRGNLLYRRYDGQLGLVSPASGRADA